MSCRPTLWPLVVAAALAAGCVTTRTAGTDTAPTPPKPDAPPTPETVKVKLPAIVVKDGGPDALALADLNASELFQVGSAAFAADEFEKAARAFDRLTVAFPEDVNVEDARFNAGLAWERMGEYLNALDRYEPLLAKQEGEPWRITAFRASEALFHLEDFELAAHLLGRIVDDPGLDMNDRIEALVKRGVCLLEAGDEEGAELSLRKGVGRYHLERRRAEEEVDDFFAAQGQFYMGELYRLRFERARLDPSTTDYETLGADLEHKAGLLLSAQGHYLRTIRMGHARWATAAGYRVGQLYEVLFDQLTGARLPAELSGVAERIAYQELLREKVQVLLTKALAAYERTLAAAERIGVDGAWRERVQASLERVKGLLIEDVERAPTG